MVFNWLVRMRKTEIMICLGRIFSFSFQRPGVDLLIVWMVFFIRNETLKESNYCAMKEKKGIRYKLFFLLRFLCIFFILLEITFRSCRFSSLWTLLFSSTPSQFNYLIFQATVKTQKGLTVTKTKKKKLETRILETEKKLQSNTQSLDRVREEMSSLVASSQELEDDVTNCQSHLKAELECAELRRQCRYFTKYTKAQEKESQATERYNHTSCCKIN